jgi:2-polyprenyl-3-methyl-5-hydroxy-6-metoxy-1,4-benzoquinol methylase
MSKSDQAVIATPLCPICRGAGRILFEDLEDRLFGVAGNWGLRRCLNCETAWLDPQPSDEAMAALYQDYFTHDLDSEPTLHRYVRTSMMNACYLPDVPATRTARILGHIGPLRELIDVELMTLGRGPGDVLDVGCGNGRFMSRIQELGWEPYGVEPDPRAVAAASQTFGSRVKQGTVFNGEFREASFDAITLNHVIEHVREPISVLGRCGELLRPGGRIIVTTPNLNSWGLRLFGPSWLGLDPPRHLVIFTPSSLRRSALSAGLRVRTVRTPARWAFWIWQTSTRLRRRGSLPGADVSDASLGLRTSALGFWAAEYIASRFSQIGEEILLVAD